MKEKTEIFKTDLAANIPYTLSFASPDEGVELSDFFKCSHWGQFAFYKKDGEGKYQAVRDPLGIGKLFYTQAEDGEIHFSEKFSSLFTYSTKIFSVPAGMAVRIGVNGKRELIHTIRAARNNVSQKDFSLTLFQESVSCRMESLFTLLAEMEKEGWSFFVALSGGLDSSLIASYSARFLKSPVACTLDLGKSEDSEKSARIASYLGIKHNVFETNRSQILDALEEAPLLCQDFRDFNVHCAALNILLARKIKQMVDADKNINKSRVAVLTGDLMNEYTCDYAGEVIDGVEYYKLPRVDRKELQNYLIGGLDTSDREISPFKAYGLKCIQPYASLYDLYGDVPESILMGEDPKKILNSFLADSTIMDFLPKVKLRAQVGSRENMGILGLCHSLGINDKTFRKNLLDHSGHGDGKIPIFVGRYDTERFE